MRTSSLRSHAGYTTMEILVASAISLVVLGTAGSFNRFQLFALRNQANQLDIQTTTRSFVDLFARDVRRAGMNPTCAAGFSAIADGGSTWLRAQSDLNGNGAIDGTDEDITYTYDPSTNQVQRTSNGRTELLIAGFDLSASTIRYYDSDGTELVPAGTGALTAAQLGLVRRVRIELAVAGSAVDPLNGRPLVARVSSDVDLRNRFFVAGITCP